ncbi:hypothetical protein SAP269_06070 [Spiroplasma ixodetis]|uniref:Uncharacterized protein n=1 Tax=Spiroplasma ixodetis TaxID=2141 RepID=A0ABN7BV77_9MOLU
MITKNIYSTINKLKKAGSDLIYSGSNVQTCIPIGTIEINKPITPTINVATNNFKFKNLIVVFDLLKLYHPQTRITNNNINITNAI